VERSVPPLTIFSARQHNIMQSAL